MAGTSEDRMEGNGAPRKSPRRSGPRIVVDGVVVSGGKEAAPKGAREAPRARAAGRLLLPVLGGAAALALLLLSAGLLSSCNAAVDAGIRADGSARLGIAAEVPPVLGAKLRKLSGAAPEAPLFDEAAVRSSAKGRPGLSVVSLAPTGNDGLKAEFAASSLKALAAEPELASSGLLTYSEGPGWAELRVRLARGGGREALDLFPFVDPYLVEALSPPALEEDPVTADEYRQMLKSVLGDKALAALETTSLGLRIQAPAAVLSSGGGSLSGTELRVALPVMELLVLEKPVEFWLRWKR